MSHQVQVGWYCTHEDEPLGESSHMSHHGKWKKRGWVETFPEPSTRKSITFLNYHDPEKRPHCARAVPVYIDASE